MNKFRSLLLLISSLFLIINCSSSPTVCKTSNTVGVWKNSISRNMGGYSISQDTELEIKRYGPGDYEYFLNQTVVDQMYGGKPKYINSSGSFKDQIIERRWRFDGGDFGEKGGYYDEIIAKYTLNKKSGYLSRQREGSPSPAGININPKWTSKYTILNPDELNEISNGNYKYSSLMNSN
jgi:hypothetical protein